MYVCMYRVPIYVYMRLIEHKSYTILFSFYKKNLYQAHEYICVTVVERRVLMDMT